MTLQPDMWIDSTNYYNFLHFFSLSFKLFPISFALFLLKSKQKDLKSNLFRKIWLANQEKKLKQKYNKTVIVGGHFRGNPNKKNKNTRIPSANLTSLES